MDSAKMFRGGEGTAWRRAKNQQNLHVTLLYPGTAPSPPEEPAREAPNLTVNFSGFDASTLRFAPSKGVVRNVGVATRFGGDTANMARFVFASPVVQIGRCSEWIVWRMACLSNTPLRLLLTALSFQKEDIYGTIRMRTFQVKEGGEEGMAAGFVH